MVFSMVLNIKSLSLFVGGMVKIIFSLDFNFAQTLHPPNKFFKGTAVSSIVGVECVFGKLSRMSGMVHNTVNVSSVANVRRNFLR